MLFTSLHKALQRGWFPYHHNKMCNLLPISAEPGYTRILSVSLVGLLSQMHSKQHAPGFRYSVTICVSNFSQWPPANRSFCTTGTKTTFAKVEKPSNSHYNFYRSVFVIRLIYNAVRGVIYNCRDFLDNASCNTQTSSILSPLPQRNKRIPTIHRTTF